MNHDMCLHKGEKKYEHACDGCRYFEDCPLSQEGMSPFDGGQP